MRVRSLAILLIALLLPLSVTAPSASACAMTACCANCPKTAPMNQLNCCKAPAAPDRATSQARGADHFDSVASLPVTTVITAISHLRSTVITCGYSPPGHRLSLALLCSRQI